MRKSIFLSMFAALLLGLCSCSDDYVGDDKDYFSNPQELCQTWQLVGYGSDEDFHMIAEDLRRSFVLVFKDDGTFYGRDAVNSYGGTYTSKNNKITIKATYITFINDRSEESLAFHSRLHAANKYGIKDGNKLRLYYSDKEFLAFEAIIEP